MRKLVFAALAALALVCPSAAFAQAQMVTTYTVPQQSGTLTTITTDSVVVPVYGGSWATARFKVTSAGTATVTAQVSIDWGSNWIASAYAKKLSAVSANPTVQAISATTLTTGDEWEVPLPANATHFRLLCGGSGTVTTVNLYGGSPYVPGEPVAAVLYDVTSGVNAALDTGILDTTGWAGLMAYYSTPAGGSGTIRPVDDTGANPSGAGITIPASAGILVSLSPGGVGAAGTVGTSGTTGATWRWKRTQATSAAVAALTSRIRIEAWR